MKVIVMKTSKTRKQHIVLLGDSTFDNAAFVADGFPVSRHLFIRVPGWQTTLLAVSGSAVSDMVKQLQKIPGDATHLFLSVGRNDALNSVHIVNSPLCRVGSALHHLGMARNNLEALNRLDSARNNFHQDITRCSNKWSRPTCLLQYALFATRLQDLGVKKNRQSPCLTTLFYKRPMHSNCRSLTCALCAMKRWIIRRSRQLNRHIKAG